MTAVPKTTLAAVAIKPQETELREFAIPEIASDAGILRILATGICGSDWGQYNDTRLGPRILGHEMVGTIEKLGDAARDRWGVKEGDLVALEEYLPCGHCDLCRAGEYRSCLETDAHLPGERYRYGSTPITRGSGLWGGYSQFLYMHPRTVIHRVPAGMPLNIAAMSLPVGNGFQWAYLDGKAGPGKTVVIIGPGQQGMSCGMAAATAGADQVIVLGLSTDVKRLEVAKKLGATHTVMVDQEDPVKVVKDLTGGEGADVIIEASSAGPAIFNQALEMIRKRGTFLCVSNKKTPIPGFNMDMVIRKQVFLRGTRGHSFQAVELAMKAMMSGRYPVELMSTHKVGLKDLDHSLRIVGGQEAEKSIHITVDPWK